MTRSSHNYSCQIGLTPILSGCHMLKLSKLLLFIKSALESASMGAFQLFVGMKVLNHLNNVFVGSFGEFQTCSK